MPRITKRSSDDANRLLAATRGLDAIREYVEAPLVSLDAGKVRRLKTGAKAGCEAVAKFLDADGRRVELARSVQSEILDEEVGPTAPGHRKAVASGVLRRLGPFARGRTR